MKTPRSIEKLLDKQKIDYLLVVSETSLAYIPRKRFHLSSRIIFDEFMIYASEVFAASLASLIKGGYIGVLNEEVKRFKFLGVTISTKEKYLVHLVKRPSHGLVLGWVEEKIFSQFTYSIHQDLDTLIHQTLNEIFDHNYRLTNPGKMLVFGIIAHQKLNLYERIHKKSWISDVVTLRLNKNPGNNLKPWIYRIEDFTLGELQTDILKKKVRKQLGKFHHLD